jgi:hypothetical protein
MIADVDLALPGWANLVLIVIGFGVAAFERIRNAKMNTSAAVNIAKDELVKVLEADRDAWKSRYATEHDEYVARREGYHTESQTIQAKLLFLTEENAMLKVKTDVTPIMEELKGQAQINQKVLKALDSIMTWCDAHEKSCVAYSPHEKGHP